MIPVIAIVGRPNVGKSTLFNRLTRSQSALVLDQPGITRDRQFGQGDWEDKPVIVIDTGGIGEESSSAIDVAITQQSHQAILESDAIFLVVDGRQGLTSIDKQLAAQLRKQAKPVFLVINKIDGLETNIVQAEFYELGFEHNYPIAASQNRGIETLICEVLELIAPLQEIPELPPENNFPKVALIGRPNVGKSTLMNRMLGEQRVIVCDLPGTTRDSIYITMERRDKSYTLIDTAGVRKRKNIFETVEKFSVVKTLHAIKDANVVVLVFDATLGLTDQDLSLIDFTIEAGKGLIICANKWDGMAPDERAQVKSQIEYRLKFAEFAPVHFISALHGTGVGDLFKVIDTIYRSAMLPLDTTQLTEILEGALIAHPPPLAHGGRIKLRYAHCGGHNPPTIVIHGNQTDSVPLTYQRYLAKYFIKALKLEGTPVRIICKTGDNPYAGKRNILTKRQIHKKRRLMRHVKK